MKAFALLLSILSIDLGGTYLLLNRISETESLEKAREEETTGKGFAVVELFTSEGCSSCPPADRLLAEIYRNSPQEEVFPLAFHVDYWNRLGWTDPYSDAAFSTRQRQYAQKLNDRVYTPMMIFNGQEVAVGSRTDDVWQELRHALKQKATVPIDLHHLRMEGREVTFIFSAPAAQSEHVINLALVQRNVTVEVKAGENRNRILEHDHVVRDFASYSLGRDQTGQQQFTLPEAEGEYILVAYVQNGPYGPVVGATRLELAEL